MQLTFAFLYGNRSPIFSDAAFVRKTVFLDEQGFSYDLDEHDADSVHLILYRDGVPVAAARAFEESDAASRHIGRVCVLSQYRGEGLGALLMQKLEEELFRSGARRLELGAQYDKQEFYRRLGYTPFGDIFLDDGAPHQMMEKILPEK